MRPFARYLEAREREHRELEMYRAFVTESLRLAPQSKFLGRTYAESLRRLDAPRETRSGREIAEDVIGRLELEVTE